MSICEPCQKQEKKSRTGKPHEALAALAEPRIFNGVRARQFIEQDYQCQSCQARFTHSTNKNDLAWTLWRG